MKRNQALIILGMHRSGTSATTGMLRCLGVELGRKLYKGHAEINAKGYFEHNDITDTNDEVLLSINSIWDDILIKPDNWWDNPKLEHYAKKITRYLKRDFSDSKMWAIKDPRVCRIIPWWIQILANQKIDANYLIVIRPPHEVYLSLNRRDGFSLEKSYLLWLLHYLDAEYWTRNLNRTFVTFESLIEDPVSIFVSIQSRLNLEFPVSPENARNCLAQFISKDLIHHKTTSWSFDLTSPLTKLAKSLYDELFMATLNHEHRLNTDLIDEIRQQVETFQQSFSPLLVEHLKQNYKIRSDLQITMNKIFRSYSWFIGKPIRGFERLFGKDV